MDKEMRRRFFNKSKKPIYITLGLIILLFAIYQLVSYREKPEEIKYGISYNVPYAQELGLDWRQVYIDMMDDLGVKRFRLAAHWDLVEPEKDVYDFTYLDFQLEEARKRDVEVILGVGRRLPRWPECHVPEWAQMMSDEYWQEELLEYIELVVERYKGYENIIMWQIENEPFLEVFAYEHCGDLDQDFLDEEIALVKSLDDSREILLTDSGNIGRWTEAYSRADIFGTSVYIYFWNPYVGKFRTILPPSFYRAKANLMELIHGEKDTMLIELSLEPWLIQPLVKTDLETQFEMMDLERMQNIIDYAAETHFEYQYLWGGEWWYWLKEKHGIDMMWEFGKELFR